MIGLVKLGRANSRQAREARVERRRLAAEPEVVQPSVQPSVQPEPEVPGSE